MGHRERTWLEAVERKLIDAGLDVVQRSRLIAELRDHWEDCVAERVSSQAQGGANMSIQEIPSAAIEEISQRMGTPQQIADAATSNRASSTMIQRHPWLMPLMALPLWAVFAAGYLITLGSIAEAWDWRSRLSPGELPWWGYAAAYGVVYVPTVLAATLLTLLAVRGRVRPGWWLASLAFPLLLAAHSHVMISLSNQPGQSKLYFGAGFPPSLQGLLQFLVPAGVAAVVWYGLKRRPRAVAV